MEQIGWVDPRRNRRNRNLWAAQLANTQGSTSSRLSDSWGLARQRASDLAPPNRCLLECRRRPLAPAWPGPALASGELRSLPPETFFCSDYEILAEPAQFIAAHVVGRTVAALFCRDQTPTMPSKKCMFGYWQRATKMDNVGALNFRHFHHVPAI